jgi:peptide/nickel transport system permease protein
MWTHCITRHLVKIIVTVLLGGLLGATLVRLSPGFGVDEQELDTRLNADSIRAVRHSRDRERHILRFYAQYLAGLLKGDLGVSHSMDRPVTELLAERIPVTLRSVSTGLVGGWFLGLALALPTAIYGSRAYNLFSTFLSGIFLCLPSAVLALLLLFAGGVPGLAIALVLFPRVFRYARNLLLETYALPHVLTAQAKGLSRIRILTWHVLPCAAPQILALAGVSVSMAFGAAIPIEAICDSPGVGQLAWLAALGRDLPVLVNLTLLVTVVTLVAGTASDLAAAMGSPTPTLHPDAPSRRRRGRVSGESRDA